MIRTDDFLVMVVSGRIVLRAYRARNSFVESTYGEHDEESAAAWLVEHASPAWDGSVMASSSMDYPEEDGWAGGGSPNEWLGRVLYRAGQLKTSRKPEVRG